jgi:small GTP-binding protein
LIGKKQMHPDFGRVLCKCVTLGNYATGKTCLLSALQCLEFSENYQPTVGGGFFKHTINYGDHEIQITLCDTAGHERFSGLTPMYCRNRDVCLLVYAVNNPQSFNDLEKWRRMIIEESPLVRFIVVATKIDLGQHAVAQDAAVSYAQEIDGKFIQTSAKSREGIQELTDQICTLALNRANKAETTQLLPAKPKKAECCGS